MKAAFTTATEGAGLSIKQEGWDGITNEDKRPIHHPASDRRLIR